MSRHLAIGLHDGGSVVMQTDVPEEAAAFDGLGRLLCLTVKDGAPENVADATLTVPDALPENRHVVRETPLTETAYTADWGRLLVAGRKKASRRPDYCRSCVWQTLLISAGLNAVLRGADAVPVHSAVLETDRGAVLIFGESGMGKSTAFRRWIACGGKGFSDDMALLDFSGDDGIHVRRLPTWSACREGRNEWNYPAGEELPLAMVFALGRSETGRDRIAELSAAQFFAQCYRSMFYWILRYAAGLPDDLKARLTSCIRRQTEIIADRFPPRALMTSFEGDLKRFVEDNL